MRFKRLFLISATLIGILIAPSFSQEDKSFHIQKCARLESGLALHFLSAKDNNKIIPGVAFQYCYGIKSSKKLGFGVGGGFQYFEKESFVPFFIDVIYFINQNKYASFINLKAGYAMGWSGNYSDYFNSSFKGGPNIGISYGKKIIRFNQLSIYICAKYNHQFASIQYENDDHQKQHKSLHYNMFIVSLGFMLEEG
jgi:hypothetical protein